MRGQTFTRVSVARVNIPASGNISSRNLVLFNDTGRKYGFYQTSPRADSGLSYSPVLYKAELKLLTKLLARSSTKLEYDITSKIEKGIIQDIIEQASMIEQLTDSGIDIMGAFTGLTFEDPSDEANQRLSKDMVGLLRLLQCPYVDLKFETKPLEQVVKE